MVASENLENNITVRLSTKRTAKKQTQSRMIIENKNIQPQPKISGSYIKRLHLDETKLIS